MGYNTVLVVYNDAIHSGAQDPALGAAIQRACQAWSARSYNADLNIFARVGNGGSSYGQVISQDHADHSQIVVVGRNSGQPLSECRDLDPFAQSQLADALRLHGWSVMPPAKQRKTKAA